MTDMIAKPDEARAFLDAHPDIQFFEVIYTGLCGVPRGKRLRRQEIMAVYEQGRFLPGSLLVADITGQDCEELVWDDGDADRVGWPVAGTLVPAPWLGEDTAQVLLSVYELDKSANPLDPRHVLARVIDRFTADGLKPVVACEIEFYLVDAKRTPEGRIMPAPSPLTGEHPTTKAQYGLRELEEASGFLRELWACADAQRIPLEGAISEYAPGQLELTLHHHDDALRAGDEAQMYKRVAKGVALKHGNEATFMAKPFADEAGSGLHLHVSVNDASGKNIFASEDPSGSPELKHAIGGMKALLADSMAIFAPNANSYRRFRAGTYAPIAAAWGVNNRTVPLRIPAGTPAGRHIEHRVAGADANPYLALAALLAGVHYGLKNKIDPGPPVSGDGYSAAAGQAPLAPHWFAAVDRFEASAILADYLGPRFVEMFAKVKRLEQDRFYSVITTTDYDWYLRTA